MIILAYVPLNIEYELDGEISSQDTFHTLVEELKDGLLGSIDLLGEFKESGLVLFIN